MVSKASEDFPEPLKPVITVKVLRGISTSIFFRLCWRAPCTVMRLSMGWKIHFSRAGRLLTHPAILVLGGAFFVSGLFFSWLGGAFRSVLGSKIHDASTSNSLCRMKP